MDPRRGKAARHRGDERGSGLVASWLGLLVFLSILLFAVQVVLNLYANSVLGSAAYDAARLAAAAGADGDAMSDAEAHARGMLGRFGDSVSFDWSASGPGEVVLRVTGRGPGVLPAAIAGPVPFGEVERTARVRVERFR